MRSSLAALLLAPETIVTNATVASIAGGARHTARP